MVIVTGTPGKCFAATLRIGSITAGLSGGLTAIGRMGAVIVTFTAGLPMIDTRSAITLSDVMPGKMRQLTFAVARCGSALLAWPALMRVLTHDVRVVEFISGSRVMRSLAALFSGSAISVRMASATGAGAMPASVVK